MNSNISDSKVEKKGNYYKTFFVKKLNEIESKIKDILNLKDITKSLDNNLATSLFSLTLFHYQIK